MQNMIKSTVKNEKYRTEFQKRYLVPFLEEVHRGFLRTNEIVQDALEPALKYENKRDIEFTAFICSILAYGRISQVKKNIHKILDPMGESPTKWLIKATDKDLLKLTKNWKHRFNTASDMFQMLKVLQFVYANHKSIEKFIFRTPIDSARETLLIFNKQIYQILSDLGFSCEESFSFFIPSPEKGSACKRMNLFLKWMVRDTSPDLGIWKSFSKKNLLVPLDTHIFKQAKSLGWTTRTVADWVTAEEITKNLKLLDSEDPTRFDFALCHLSIHGTILSVENLHKQKLFLVTN